MSQHRPDRSSIADDETDQELYEAYLWLAERLGIDVHQRPPRPPARPAGPR